MRNLLLVITLISIGLSLGACKKDRQIVAKVGNEKITETILNEKLSIMPAESQKYVATPLGRKQFVDAVVREAILVEAAKKAGINKRPEYKKAVNNFEKQYSEYKNGLLIDTYIKELHEDIKPTDEDIQAYYDKNKSSFENPMAYVIRHIIFQDLQSARNAYERLQNGESFEKVAKEISQDNGSAANGGLIGPFKRGDIVPELEQVVLNLKNNEMSEIVETSFGYHIIFKISENKLPSVSFDEAKKNIIRTLEQEKFDKWLAQEKQKLGVEVKYDLPTIETESQK